MASSRLVDLAVASQTSGVPKDLKPILKMVHDFGWTGKRTGSGGVEATSPDGTVKIYVPNNTKDAGTVAKRLNQKVMSWYKRTVLDKDGLDHISEDAVDITPVPGAEGEAAVTARCKEHDVEFATWEAYSAHVAAEHPSTRDVVIDEKEVPVTAVAEAPESPTMSTEGVTKQPWLAIGRRSAGGKVDTYRSETVLEVSQDGKVLHYECALEGCDYTSSQPRSVSAHYGKHVSRGEAEPVEVGVGLGEAIITRPPQYAEGTRMKSDLAKEIYTAMRSRSRHRGEADSKYAAALAEKIIDARAEAGITETLSAEESTILDRIRDLLGVSQTSAQMEALSAEAATLREERDAALAAAEEANKKASAARETLAALAELATQSSE